MSGYQQLFQTLMSTPPMAVEGISGSATAAGTGSIVFQLHNGATVTLTDVLYVPGMQATLDSTHRPYANQGLVIVFGDKGSILSRDKVIATSTKQVNGLCVTTLGVWVGTCTTTCCYPALKPACGLAAAVECTTAPKRQYIGTPPELACGQSVGGPHHCTTTCGNLGHLHLCHIHAQTQ